MRLQWQDGKMSDVPNQVERLGSDPLRRTGLWSAAGAALLGVFACLAAIAVGLVHLGHANARMDAVFDGWVLFDFALAATPLILGLLTLVRRSRRSGAGWAASLTTASLVTLVAALVSAWLAVVWF
jgi:hypothetical protein